VKVAGAGWLAAALIMPAFPGAPLNGYSLIRTAHTGTGLPAPVLIGGAVLVLLAMAWLVHRCVERPLAPLVRAVVRGPAPPAGPGAGPPSAGPAPAGVRTAGRPAGRR